MIASSQRPRGFTLIELMVSMAIGMIILLVATTMLASSGDGYERIGGGVTAQRDARAAISQISMDFATAKFHPDTVFQESKSSWAVDNIGFLSLQPTEAQTAAQAVGDICAINYYVADEVIEGKTVRRLMRGFSDSKPTFAQIKANNLSSLFAVASADEPIAFGVVSFKARPMTRNTAGQWSAWTPPTSANPAIPNTGPGAVEITLVIARRDLAAKLTKAADWDGTDQASATGKLLGTFQNKDKNKNLEIYSTLIRFGNEK